MVIRMENKFLNVINMFLEFCLKILFILYFYKWFGSRNKIFIKYMDEEKLDGRVNKLDNRIYIKKEFV